MMLLNQKTLRDFFGEGEMIKEWGVHWLILKVGFKESVWPRVVGRTRFCSVLIYKPNYR